MGVLEMAIPIPPSCCFVSRSYSSIIDRLNIPFPPPRFPKGTRDSSATDLGLGYSKATSVCLIRSVQKFPWLVCFRPTRPFLSTSGGLAKTSVPGREGIMAESSSSDTLGPFAVQPPSETTALLPKPPVSTLDESYPVRQWLAEILLLAKAAIPVILAYTLQNSLQTLSVLIVGRLSPEALATAAFSYMFAMATAWLVALGGTTALDTLASSSFTGSSNKHDLGILLQRGIIVLSVFYAVVAVLWWFSEPVFRALGQEEFICVQSSAFLRCLIPGGLGYVWFEAMKKYLQAQGKSKAPGIDDWQRKKARPS